MKCTFAGLKSLTKDSLEANNDKSGLTRNVTAKGMNAARQRLRRLDWATGALTRSADYSITATLSVVPDPLDPGRTTEVRTCSVAVYSIIAAPSVVPDYLESQWRGCARQVSFDAVGICNE